MKFSEVWLREWVNPSSTTDELTHQLTMAGLEVDGASAVCGQFTGVKIGEVVTCAQHPDADKLRVTKVDVGDAELLDIVCGASNCRQGLKVAVAVVGAVLPGDFKIKQAKLRGQPSHGMLCSFSELGINDGSDGIIELPQDAPIGMDIKSYLALDDAIIDIDLTANRADCFSLRGLARETGVLNQLDVSYPRISPVAPSTDEVIAIDVEAKDACPRYLARVISDLDLTAPTPIWMIEKLRRSGIRSIDAVVDVTNFVLLEQGQPMHAFDLDKINGRIIVRQSTDGEKLTLLDGNEVTLNNTLVIADEQKALAMAGIFGGQDSGVSQTTKRIVLECAYFSADHIRGKARAYGLRTESSLRFERGVDFQLPYQAIERATQLLLDICGGQAGPVIDESSVEHLPTPNKVLLRKQKLGSLLGIDIADDTVVDILTRLGMSIEPNAEGWQVVAPSWRFDISIEQDLIEEVGRIYGYDNIPNQSPFVHLAMLEQKESDLSINRVRQLLVDRNFHEAITYSFVEPELQKQFSPIDALVLPNPISIEMSAMRTGLLQGLLSSVVYNQKRQQARVRLFEYGLRFVPSVEAENGIAQEPILAGVIAGEATDEQWDIKARTVDFFDLKSDVEAILALTGDKDRFKFVRSTHQAFHPGQSADIVLNDEVVGVMGTIHPTLERQLGLNGRTVAFEINWQAINQQMIPSAVSLSKYPANRRDIAVVVDSELAADSVVSACYQAKGRYLTSAQLFDVYQGEGMDEDKKSLAIALMLQSDEKTLEEADISAEVGLIVEQLANQFGAYLR